MDVGREFQIIGAECQKTLPINILLFVVNYCMVGQSLCSVLSSIKHWHLLLMITLQNATSLWLPCVEDADIIFLSCFLFSFFLA